tara:strand:+ start:131 stop:655 length:525 start_codon:yes stop_codon:yes gene_type:complete
MESNFKLNKNSFVTEVYISNSVAEDEKEMYTAYMSECMTDEAMFVDTAGMSSSDAKYMCGMSYNKDKSMLMQGSGELTDEQKDLPTKLKIGILKRYEKAGTLSEEGKKQLESLAGMMEMKAEPTAVFVEEPAPDTGEITPRLAKEGLKIDESLKKEKTSPKNPGLQSPTFKSSN